jgi:primosomal protein N' (replication factor Y)
MIYYVLIALNMEINPTYIEVAVALPLTTTFTYTVPEELRPFVMPGKRVLVPFGRRRVTGYILQFCGNQGLENVKNILDILDEVPLFPESMIPFFKWIADYYIYPIGEVIKCALPSGLNVFDFTTVALTESGKTSIKDMSLSSIEREIMQSVKNEPCSIKNIFRSLNKDVPRSCISRLENKGLIKTHRTLKGSRVRPNMERYVVLNTNETIEGRLSTQRKKIVDHLRMNHEVSLKMLKEIVPSAARIVKSMAESGYVSIGSRRVYRDPFGESIQADTDHELTAEQEDVIANILTSLGKGFAPYLLTGVTGSGKTEVYMQLTDKAIKLGYSVIILVPEIALISQMERRFRARFGECIAVLHSGLSDSERYDQWLRIVSGDVSIALGARSAIFAPFVNIGLIIVDEEHDASYKQESGIRYNARDLAVVRAKQAAGVVLLGSATPSIQSYYNTRTQKFSKGELTERVESRPLPEVSIVDLREFRDSRGAKKIITPLLQEAMKEALNRREQILLFLNRRGFSSFSVCASCGEAIRCKNCDISLTFHKGENAYKCHYCGFFLSSASACTSCGSPHVRLLGLGTEKVEEVVRSLFPEARTARMDRDTTTKKGSILTMLKALKDQKLDVLIGTQMVAKGHDFPNITLVGIICADLSLNFPDFRAGERTFQLLAQVAGRAGRGDTPGKVILQTYNPDHFSIITAKEQDFNGFYNKEIVHRKSLNYPPFSRIIYVRISGKDENKTRQYAQGLGAACHTIRKREKGLLKSIEILGPIESTLQKIATYYRWQILLKGTSSQYLHQFVHSLFLENIYKTAKRDVQVVIDVDPLYMM